MICFFLTNPKMVEKFLKFMHFTLLVLKSVFQLPFSPILNQKSNLFFQKSSWINFLNLCFTPTLFSLIAPSPSLIKFYVYLCKAWSALCIMQPAVSCRATGQCSLNTRACIETLWMILHLSSELVRIFQAENNNNKKSECEKRKHYKRKTKVKMFSQSLCSQIYHHFFLNFRFFIALMLQISFFWVR